MGRPNIARWQDTLTNALVQGAQRADPDAAEVVQLAQQIVATERRPGGLLDPTKRSVPSAFKISDLKRPMQAYLYVRRHPVVLYAVPLGVLAIAFILGRASTPTSKERAP